MNVATLVHRDIHIRRVYEDTGRKLNRKYTATYVKG